MHRSFRQHAFSLIDLLCSLILLSILLAVAIPNLQLLIKRHEERSVREMLTAYLNDTRARAIISHRGHTLCGSSDGSTCDGDWASNWLVTAADGELLQRYQLGIVRKSLLARRKGKHRVPPKRHYPAGQWSVLVLSK